MDLPEVRISKKSVSQKTTVLTAYLTFRTSKRYDFIRITHILQEIVEKSGIREGLCFVAPMHITSSVFVNDDEEGLHADFFEWLEKLAPYNPAGYKHNLTGEDNADAHLKRTIMGRETVLAVTEGRLDLGPWEEVFYGEFDGQRPKRVIVKVIGTGE